MDFKKALLDGLRARRGTLASRSCFVGFDGFVDTIVAPVDRRTGPGERFEAFATIADFGRRVTAAAGKSTNIELYPRLDKLGGNGPIMAGALAAQGAAVTCAGAFGQGSVHPAFAGLARSARLVSLCEPARTTAVEFTDGKLMLGMMKSLDEINPAAIAAAFGGSGYGEALAASDLVALANWTMIPNMTAVFDDLTGRVLPLRPSKPGRIFFFDLADPEKRSREDLSAALHSIGRFMPFGQVTLGLNLSEAEQVSKVLAIPVEGGSPEGLRSMAAKIRKALAVTTVVVHPKESAACATENGDGWVLGPYAERPLITTGAGDHFNAGFAAGQLLGLEPESCLGLGVTTSGSYVRTGKSPSGADIERFLAG